MQMSTSRFKRTSYSEIEMEETNTESEDEESDFDSDEEEPDTAEKWGITKNFYGSYKWLACRCLPAHLIAFVFLILFTLVGLWILVRQVQSIRKCGSNNSKISIPQTHAMQVPFNSTSAVESFQFDLNVHVSTRESDLIGIGVLFVLSFFWVSVFLILPIIQCMFKDQVGSEHRFKSEREIWTIGNVVDVFDTSEKRWLEGTITETRKNDEMLVRYYRPKKTKPKVALVERYGKTVRVSKNSSYKEKKPSLLRRCVVQVWTFRLLWFISWGFAWGAIVALFFLVSLNDFLEPAHVTIQSVSFSKPSLAFSCSTTRWWDKAPYLFLTCQDVSHVGLSSQKAEYQLTYGQIACVPPGTVTSLATMKEWQVANAPKCHRATQYTGVPVFSSGDTCVQLVGCVVPSLSTTVVAKDCSQLSISKVGWQTFYSIFGILYIVVQFLLFWSCWTSYSVPFRDAKQTLDV